MNIDFKDVRKRVKGLEAKLNFADARGALFDALEHVDGPASTGSVTLDQRAWLKQRLAYCIYKDPQLLPDRRFDEALAILQRIDLATLVAASVCETLGLMGAVYKRRFEHTGNWTDLIHSHAHYLEAWRHDPLKDRGYGGANAAFVMDILADRSRSSTCLSPLHQDYKAQAYALRRELKTNLNQQLTLDPKLGGDYWFLVTLAEVHFGLDEWAAAETRLAEARVCNPDLGMLESTTRQLVTLARLRGKRLPTDDEPETDWAEPWRALLALLGADTRRALSCFRGKIGLALSGGGFRASFFHIGVLARMAEMDVLRGIEVLSTVSGGSIVGAHYYLLLRKLLQEKQDTEIRSTDYVDLVRELEQQFTKGVARNIRMRTFGNLVANLRMMFSLPFGKFRTVRLGKLYERELFSRVEDGHPAETPRKLRDLLINPAGHDAGKGSFVPGTGNWRRCAKVPALVMNATSLNTGHAWHFNAKGMGEPPALIGEEVDMKRRYRRPFYDQLAAQPFLKDYSLGQAVAASSCVPGLFAPLELKRMYDDRVVALVDGGVHDNQGVRGLLAEGCNFILCSDASGQMDEVKKPSGWGINVLTRSNQTLMERVRESTYQHLRQLADSHALSGLFFVHLKQGLDAQPLDWLGCDQPSVPASIPSVTDYGIAADLQALLAGIRTDLDSFSETEISALMLSGYRMTEHAFQSGLRGNATKAGFNVDAPREQWRFLELESTMRSTANEDPQRADLALQLSVASQVFGKSWRLLRPLRWAASLGITLVAGGVLVALAAAFKRLWHEGYSIPATHIDLGTVCDTLVTLLVFIALALLTLTVIANLTVWIFDPMRLNRGKLPK